MKALSIIIYYLISVCYVTAQPNQDKLNKKTNRDISRTLYKAYKEAVSNNWNLSEGGYVLQLTLLEKEIKVKVLSISTDSLRTVANKTAFELTRFKVDLDEQIREVVAPFKICLSCTFKKQQKPEPCSSLDNWIVATLNEFKIAPSDSVLLTRTTKVCVHGLSNK